MTDSGGLPVWSYEQPPEPVPLRLPVWGTVRQAWAVLFDDLPAFLKAALVPFLLLAYASYVDLTGGTDGGSVAAMFADTLAFLLLSFSWYRRRLLPADGHRPPVLRCFALYLLYSVVLLLVLTGLAVLFWVSIGMGAQLMMETGPSHDVLVLAVVVPVVALTIAFHLFFYGRFILVFPSLAIGAGVTLRASWFLMSGNVWRLMATCVLAVLPPLSVGFLCATLFEVEAATASSLSVGVIASLQAMASVFGIAVFTGVAALAFRTIYDRLTLPLLAPMS